MTLHRCCSQQQADRAPVTGTVTSAREHPSNQQQKVLLLCTGAVPRTRTVTHQVNTIPTVGNHACSPFDLFSSGLVSREKQHSLSPCNSQISAAQEAIAKLLNFSVCAGRFASIRNSTKHAWRLFFCKDWSLVSQSIAGLMWECALNMFPCIRLTK